MYDAVNLGESGFRVTAGVLEDVSMNLTEFDIPDGVTRIGKRAFANCKKLTRVIIPNSVTKISYHAFDGCTSLTNVVYKGKTYIYSNIKDLYKAINGN